ncbi:MAG: hypothetical protein JXQ85_03755 [Cognatishimia sp.]|uniref:hypothetical protein n=1 Tax=Cognatishimia sp. TaxID=2211648 RepID=UPI003B8D8A4F
MTLDLLIQLKQIAKSAPESVLEQIARHDSYEKPEGTAKHLRQLIYLIHERDCELDWETMSWYPHEAISLASYKKRDVDVFAVSIALLLIFDLCAGEDSDAMESMLGKLSDNYISSYQELPDRYREPILAGVEMLRSRWPDELH